METKKLKLAEIIQAVGGDCSPSIKDLEITSIADFDNADENSISFLKDKKYLKIAEASKASAIFVSPGVSVKGKNCIEVKDPYLAYAKTAQLFENKYPKFGRGIHGSAIIGPETEISVSTSVGPLTVIGKNCIIGENCEISASVVIENNVSIGNDCRIDSGVVIRSGTMIGDRVIIQSNSVIGAEGFGNAMENGKFIRIPCFGNVVLEDDVEIGACVTIDRGNFINTKIGKGVRIDNLVMIAHNVQVGENSAMAAQVGISGSTKIGKSVILAGQAGLAGHLNIGDGAFIGAQGGVLKDIDPGDKVAGYPARSLMLTRRLDQHMLRLPEMSKEIKSLRKEIEKLKRKS